jgi:hypothetical protein
MVRAFGEAWDVQYWDFYHDNPNCKKESPCIPGSSRDFNIKT